jgi:hypothetical protein
MLHWLSDFRGSCKLNGLMQELEGEATSPRMSH